MAPETKTKILIIDDDPLLRKVVANIFEEDAYQILEADDGATGLESALSNLPQLMIVDLRMPRMSGLDFLRSARAHPAIGHIPIIVSTGMHSTTQALECLRHGAAGYFAKPFDRAQLRRRVKSLLGHDLNDEKSGS